MALKYVGRADSFRLDAGGKEYHPGDTVPISKKRAAQMAAASNLHRFVDDGGHDILEAATTPSDPNKAAPKP